MQTGLFAPHLQPQIIRLPVGARHFDELVDVADGWNVVRNERLELPVQLDVVRFVPSDVLEQVPDLFRDLQGLG